MKSKVHSLTNLRSQMDLCVCAAEVSTLDGLREKESRIIFLKSEKNGNITRNKEDYWGKNCMLLNWSTQVKGQIPKSMKLKTKS